MTTKANDIVHPIHDKAMPVILRNRDEIEKWLTADWAEAKSLQRSLPDEDLVIVERAPLEEPEQPGLL